MADRPTERGISLMELMRSAYSSFDDNVLKGTGENWDLASTPIPMTIFGEKARLLEGIQIIFPSVALSSSDILEQENSQLRNENLMLREAIRRIEERLTAVESSQPKGKVIVVREMPRAEAEKEVRALFSTGKTLYYSDIAQELGLDLELVVDICNELRVRGEIETDDRVSQSR